MTHLYEAGCPEKLIKEVTGHKSDTVREYERTPNSLKHAVSATLSKAPKNFEEAKIPRVEMKTENLVHEGQTGLTLQECIQAAGVQNIVGNVDGKKVKKMSVQIDLEYEEKQ